MEIGAPFILLWLACIIGTAMIASNKGHSGCLWLILAFLFGPLALLIIAVMGPAAPKPPTDPKPPVGF